jgi:NDP-sugar pyrophosphorylase family protein
MKIILLSAGKGTRLMPITAQIPKCLVSIDGIPLLERQIRWIVAQGIPEENIGINTHYLHEQVLDFIRTFHPNVYVTYEPQILGTAGALHGFTDFIGRDTFGIMLCDTLTDLPISYITTAYRRHSYSCIVSAGYVDASEARTKGVISPGRKYRREYPVVGTIESFEEKANVEGSAGDYYRVWSGMAVLSPSVLRLVKHSEEQCISEIFQTLCKDDDLGFIDTGYGWHDVGTKDNLDAAPLWLRQRKQGFHSTIL